MSLENLQSIPKLIISTKDNKKTMTSQQLRVPIRDRVLIHLKEFKHFNDAVEVPYGMSQAGIARALSVNRAQITRVLSELKTKDLIDERVTYVKGVPRRCKTYTLAFPGEVYADRLKTMLLCTNVELRDLLGGRYAVVLNSVFEKLDTSVWFSQFIFAVLEDRVVLDFSAGLAVGMFEPEIEPRIGEGPLIPATPMSIDQQKPVVEGKPLEPVPTPVPTPKPAAQTTVPTDPEAVGPGQTATSTGMATLVPTSKTQEKAQLEEYNALYKTSYGSVMDSNFYDPVRPRIVFDTDIKGEQPKANSGVGRMLVGMILAFVGIIFFVMVLSGVGPTYLLAPICCMWAVMLFIVGLYMLMGFEARTPPGRPFRFLPHERKMIIGSFVVVLIITFAGFAILMNLALQLEDYLVIAVAGLTLYLAVLAATNIPPHVRSELGVSAGLFLIMTSLGLTFFPSGVQNSMPMLGIWLTMGTGLLLMARDVGGLGPFSILRAGLPGLGASISLLFGILLYSKWPAWSLDILTVIVLWAWMFLGFYLITLPFQKPETIKATYSSLGNVALLCFGVALIVVGVALIIYGIYVGAVELVLAAPSLYYGYMRIKESPGSTKTQNLVTLCLLLFIEVMSLVRVLFVF